MENKASEILFDFLRDIFYDPAGAKLDLEQLDEEFVQLGKGLMFFAECFAQYNALAEALSKGDLSVPVPPPENELAAPLKSLHASLKHLTWQTQNVARGDYKQRVDFMGEFADAFNTMTRQLAERQQELEDEIELSHRKTLALEQNNRLLTNITKSIPQQIIVVDRETGDLLFMNGAASDYIRADEFYVTGLLAALPERDGAGSMNNVEISYSGAGEERVLSLSSYLIEWNESSAEAFVIRDVSEEKNQLKLLETQAYRDALTQLHNRFSGMLTLGDWLDEKRRFALVFADLDNLKLINDMYGHEEGDRYIITAAECLSGHVPDTMACRIGGDEFMLMLPDMGHSDATAAMEEISQKLQNHEYLNDKEYEYSLSYGIAVVDESTDISSSALLSVADERMYEHKRQRKKQRRETAV